MYKEDGMYKNKQKNVFICFFGIQIKRKLFRKLENANVEVFSFYGQEKIGLH